MATIDLGKIKIVWKGTYSGGTAYVIDEAVVHSGTSYICIANTTGNAPPNGTYWNVLAQAGTNGTDVGTTLTTQGDILYRDGSGLARLGYGTSGKVLTTKGSGQNPAWETAVGGKIGQVIQTVKRDAFSTTNGISGSGMVGVTGLSVAITPSATSSKILVSGSLSLAGADRHYCRLYINGSESDFKGDAIGSAGRTLDGHYDAGTTNTNRISFQYLHTSNSTSAQTYQWYVSNNGGDGQTTYVNKHASTSGNSISDNTSVSEITAMEVLA
jgi:hypothetical protein